MEVQEFGTPVMTPPANTRLTKRSFWNRFPQANLIAMQAVLRSGTPALLAGQLGAMQLLVSDSPFVDVALAQTIDSLTGPQGLSSEAFPATVVIDGQTLPLRISSAQAAAILAPPVAEEAYVPGGA